MPGEAVANAPAAALGYFGKVPSRGDFVRRGLPRRFVEPWDRWIQQSIARSRAQLGDSWLDFYLAAPIWRFALSPGICGDDMALGLFMPSVDSVGRYYPLSLAAVGPAPGNLFAVMAAQESWFERAEAAALSCLDEGARFEVFEASFDDLGLPAPVGETPAAAADAAAFDPGADGDIPGQAWSLQGEGGLSLGAGVYPALLEKLLHGGEGPYSLWSTSGSDDVAPRFAVHRELPPADRFAWFFTGAAPGPEATEAPASEVDSDAHENIEP